MRSHFSSRASGASIVFLVLVSNFLNAAAVVVLSPPPTGVPTPAPSKSPSSTRKPTRTRLTAVSIDAGGKHTCAVLSNGRTKCWGANNQGQLGQGDVNNRGDNFGELGNALRAISLGSHTVKSVAAGGFHTCAVLDDDTARCWGYGYFQELGLNASTYDNIGDGPNEMGKSLKAIPFRQKAPVKSMCTGDFYTCALFYDGSLTCFGANHYGVLGLGDNVGHAYTSSLPRVDLGTGRTATAISCGGYVACALLDTAAIKCWGDNQYGASGQGTSGYIGNRPGQMGNALDYIDLGTGRTATAIAAGGAYDAFVCALLDDKTVKCWGANPYGELGQGNTLSLGDQPGEMGNNLLTVNLGTNRTAKAIAAGAFHMVAILDDDTVRTWGWNNYGQLGRGDLAVAVGDGAGEMGDNLVQVNLGTGRTAKAVTAGDFHTCVLLDDGSVKCLGYNADGQAGIGSSTAAAFKIGDTPSEMGDTLLPVDFGTA